MADVADTNPGAARQTWWAALLVPALILAGERLAFLPAPGAPILFDYLSDLAFAAAGFAATRLMLPDRGRRLVDVWAAAVRWSLPALVTVVVAVLVAGVALLPPADLKNQAWAALWTAIGVSGGGLMREGPFDPATSDELLLHLWATGVAAQLIVGWTVIVAVMRGVGLARIGAVAGLGLVLSLGLEVWMRGEGLALHAFYLAPANAWPFLLGASLAGWLPEAIRIRRSWRSGAARAADLAWPFCLWLWPLAALPRMVLARSPTGWEWGAVVIAAGLLALATQRWIERPVRRRLGSRPQTALLFGAGCAAVVAAASAAIIVSGGFPVRADARLLTEAAAVLQRPPLQAACHVERRARRPNPGCTTPPGGPAEVVVWGNSHASHLTPAVLDWTARRGLRMRQATKSGCLPLLESGGGLISDNCLAFNRAAVAEMGEGPPPRLVILGAAWTVIMARAPGDDRAEAEGLERDLAATVRRVRAVVGPEAAIILLGDTPDFAFAPAACHARRRFLELDTRRCDLSPPANAAMASVMDQVLVRVAASEPGVRVFRPASVLCADGLCRTRGPEGPWYADRHHLTPAGGRAQSAALAGALDAAWTRP